MLIQERAGVAPDLKGIAKGPDSYWARSMEVGYFSTNTCCMLIQERAGVAPDLKGIAKGPDSFWGR
jgi:hypothetical protein